nr:hypothetical protein [Desulfobacula sp.]
MIISKKTAYYFCFLLIIALNACVPLEPTRPFESEGKTGPKIYGYYAINPITINPIPRDKDSKGPDPNLKYLCNIGSKTMQYQFHEREKLNIYTQVQWRNQRLLYRN